MKKIFTSVMLGLVLTVVLSGNLVKAVNLDAALATLPQYEEWSIMAHASLAKPAGYSYLASPINNSVATDYEKRILAIVAQGENPSSFGSEDFVAKLKSFYDGTQIGDRSLLNDDIFGILALVAANQTSEITQNSRSYLLQNQNSDGGWGFATNTGSDTNTTAMALVALSQTGGIPSNAVSYIHSALDQTGGYGFTPGSV